MMIAPTTSESSGSIQAWCVSTIIAPPATTTIAPSASPATWTSAARVLRSLDAPRSSTSPTARFTPRPIAATTIMRVPSGTTGCRKRCTASIAIATVTPKSSPPLASAPKISSRAKPKVCVTVAGRCAFKETMSAMTSATTSMVTCAASEISESEPEAKPPQTSSTATHAVAASAIRSRAGDAPRA